MSRETNGPGRATHNAYLIRTGEKVRHGMPRVKQEASRLDELQEVAKDIRGSFLTVEEMTESFIRQAILRGVFRPGERVPQDEIAAALGVSRMPVRASLRPLEAEGLLDIRPHRGAIVASLRREEITEL